MAAVLMLVAAILWWREKPYFLNFVYPGLLLAALGILAPAWLLPLQRVWMALAVLLGFVMSHLILTTIYFVMFTPVALFLRILQKDVLHQRSNEKAESYWVKRTPVRYLPQSSEKMF